MRRRLAALFSWQVAGTIGVYVVVALLVALYGGLFVALHNAQSQTNAVRAAAIRRVDLLQHELAGLEDRLRHSQVSDARERGRLEDAIRALAEQIRQLGGAPVTDGGSGRASSTARPTPTSTHAPSHHTPRPSPSPSHSPHPHPTPSPSPSCIVLHLVCITSGDAS